MKRLGIVVGLCMAASSAFAGGDFGPLNTVHETYNRAAKEFGASSRMLLVTCVSEMIACQYSVSGNMMGVSKGEANTKGRASTLAIIFGKDSEATEFLVALGVSMVAWSPKSDKDERGLALASLVEAVTKQDPKEIVLDGTRYRLATV